MARNGKRRIPTETYDNKDLMEVIREYPSLDCLSKAENKKLESRTGHLMDFEDKARTPFQVVDYISDWLSGRPQFEERNIFEDVKRDQKKKYFFKDPWEQGSMVIVKEGITPIKYGFHLILAHSDSPCLMIKPRPVKVEVDPREVNYYLGLRLSAVAHGGLSPTHWRGQQVKIIGYRRGENGEKIPMQLHGSIGDISAHVDHRQEQTVREAFPPEESFEVMIGYSGIKETLKRLNMTSIDDFAKSKLFVVPTNDPQPMDEYNWRLLMSYGHDDKAGVYSAVDAIIKTREPKYTSIIWITDKEESGDTSPSGAQGSLIEHVLEYLVEKLPLSRRISKREKMQMYLKSSMIFGDVNIAPYGHDAKEMDAGSAPKIGFGVAISADEGSVSDSNFASKLINLAKKDASRGNNICHQVCGNFYSQDNEDLSYLDSNDGLTKKIGGWGCVGTPCAAVHSHNEIICPGDEYWTSKFYRRFFESDITLK